MATIASQILNGDLDNELDIIDQAIRTRHKIVQTIRSAEIVTGSNVKLVANISPKGLAGIPGTVTSIVRGKAVVQLDERGQTRVRMATTRGYMSPGGTLRVPLSLLEPA